MNIPEDHLDAVMRRAVAKELARGGSLAYIANAAHVAYAYGEDHIRALAKLRTVVAENWLPLLHALKTIEGREAC